MPKAKGLAERLSHCVGAPGYIICFGCLLVLGIYYFCYETCVFEFEANYYLSNGKALQANFGATGNVSWKTIAQQLNFFFCIATNLHAAYNLQ